jgi:hypothetical protein
MIIKPMIPAETQIHRLLERKDALAAGLSLARELPQRGHTFQLYWTISPQLGQGLIPGNGFPVIGQKRASAG